MKKQRRKKTAPQNYSTGKEAQTKQHSLDAVLREINSLREKLQGLPAVNKADAFRRNKALATLEGCKIMLMAACMSPGGDEYYEFDFTQNDASAT